MLRSLPDAPRNDWVEEVVVKTVTGIAPTPSAPRGALRFIAIPAGQKGKAEGGGGMRCVSFDDIVEVI